MIIFHLGMSQMLHLCMQCFNFQVLMGIYPVGMSQMLQICLKCLQLQKILIKIFPIGMFQMLQIWTKCFLMRIALIRTFLCGMYLALIAWSLFLIWSPTIYRMKIDVRYIILGWIKPAHGYTIGQYFVHWIVIRNVTCLNIFN